MPKKVNILRLTSFLLIFITLLGTGMAAYRYSSGKVTAAAYAKKAAQKRR
jgi:hypothetical protein